MSHERNLTFTLRPLSAEDAAKINTWVYEPPYSIYGFSGDSDDFGDLMNGRYLGAFDETNELIGFFCTGESAQVPGAGLVGIYEVTGYLDIGLGLKPDLTGKGIGGAFLRQAMEYVTQTFQAKKLRLAVAAFNKRAIEVYRRAGFREDRTFTSMVGITNLTFLSMVREEFVKLFGTITDFEGRPLEDAWVCLRNEKFEDLYEIPTDRHGRYELWVKSGLYYTLFACKDYGIHYLEYWAWNLPLYGDYELNARIDGVEVYSLSAFSVKRITKQLMLYFRPMTLKRSKAYRQSPALQDSSAIIDIGPELVKEDIEARVNGEVCSVHEVNRVVEYGGGNQAGEIKGSTLI